MREIAIGRGGTVRPINVRGRELSARGAGTAVEADLASVEVTRESGRKTERPIDLYVCMGRGAHVNREYARRGYRMEEMRHAAVS